MTQLKNIAQALRPTEYLSYRDYLGALFQRAKESLTKYSYRQFSTDLGLGDTNISWLFVTGRRQISAATAKKLAVALGLKNSDRRYFLALVEYNNARTSTRRESMLKQLLEIRDASLDDSSQQKAFRYFGEWFHPVIREMAALDEFNGDPNWISQQLVSYVPPAKVQESLELLQELDLVHHDATTQRLTHTGQQLVPPKGLHELSIIRFHQRMIELAKDAVTAVKEQDRDINALTVAVSKESLDKIRTMVEDLCMRILELEQQDKGARHHVLQFNSQLFPLLYPKRGPRHD